LMSLHPINSIQALKKTQSADPNHEKSSTGFILS